LITSKDQPARYKLKFLPEALKEWHQLDGSIKLIFRKALKKRLIQPKVPGSELQGDLKDCYKIKYSNTATDFFTPSKIKNWWSWYWQLIKEKTQLRTNQRSFVS
jgi:hypothetical protein